MPHNSMFLVSKTKSNNSYISLTKCSRAQHSRDKKDMIFQRNQFNIDQHWNEGRSFIEITPGVVIVTYHMTTKLDTI